jgi:hypothetical protein
MFVADKGEVLWQSALSFERELVWKLPDVGFVTLLFLLEDLTLMPSLCPGLLSQNLVGDSLQGDSEREVLTFVGAVVVALV